MFGRHLPSASLGTLAAYGANIYARLVRLLVQPIFECAHDLQKTEHDERDYEHPPEGDHIERREHHDENGDDAGEIRHNPSAKSRYTSI